MARILSHGGFSIAAEEREDLEQEIVTEVWQAVNRASFDFSGGFWGFVEVVTARRCIDWLRTQRAKVPLLDEVVSDGTSPLRWTLEQERTALASAVLSALDPQCRELLVHRLGDDLSYGEIARLTGRSEGALRVQLYRCIRRARELMPELGGGCAGER